MDRRRWMILGSLAGCGSERDSLLATHCDPGIVFNEIAAGDETRSLAPEELCVDSESWCCNARDWLEVANVSDAPVNIGDYVVVALVDDPRRSLSPDGPLLLGAGAFLVVALVSHLPDVDPTCDGLGFPFLFSQTDVGSEGTDMQLLFGAETCDERPFPNQPADFSWSRQGDGGWCDTLPSPGRANHPCLWSAR